MNEITLFQNPEFGEIRAVEIDGEAWFVGKDVAEILGYTNSAKAIRDHIDDEDKLTERIVLSGQMREVIFINESGLYSLILSSKLPKAKEVKRWVTSEVLPSIRKHGAYMTQEVIEKTLASAINNNPDFIIQLATSLKEEREKNARLLEQNGQQRQQLAELKPKATYYDLILQSKSTCTVGQIAKDYGLSSRALNSLLAELKVQYKQRDTWLLYQDYADKGYTQSRTYAIDADRSKMSTYWTQKGRMFIYDLLKNKKDLLPTIEREEKEKQIEVTGSTSDDGTAAGN